MNPNFARFTRCHCEERSDEAIPLFYPPVRDCFAAHHAALVATARNDSYSGFYALRGNDKYGLQADRKACWGKKTEGKNMQEKTQASSYGVGATDEGGKIIQLIVFNLGDEEFSADISQVREIIMAGVITPIPDSPEFIKGVTNIRGEIGVVIDLKARFFLSAKEEVESKHILITEQEKNLFGLMVDEVTEVLRIPEREIKGTPELVTRIDRAYVSGMITLENRLIIMLDLTRVLSEEELARLSELSRRRRAVGESEGPWTRDETVVRPQQTEEETVDEIESVIAEGGQDNEEQAGTETGTDNHG